MTTEQRDYHSNRAREELDRAAMAQSADAERRHRELASLHMEKVSLRLAPSGGAFFGD